MVLNSATADKLIGGTEKTTISDKYVDGTAKDSKSLSTTVSKGVSGKLTISDGASAAEISNYSTVTVNNASTGIIKNTVIKNTRKETSSFDQAKGTVSRNVTLSHSETASGTLNAANATLGNVTGFATVTLKNVENAGDLRRVAEDGSAYSTVKETLKISTGKVGIVSGSYTKTETFTRSGKLTATDSVIGNVENFNTVTLSGTSAGDISNILDSKITTTGGTFWNSANEYGSTDDYSIDLSDFNLQTAVKRSLSGSVTLKNGADVVSVTDFKTLTMTGSEVGTVTNVSKVTVNKGNSTIGSYTGSSGNDTLSVAKGAVLVSNAIDLGGEAKDTIKLSGTLVMNGSTLNAAKITGKGEIAAADGIDLNVDFDRILNVGATSENFRGTAYEMADDKLSKAVKWDGSAEYCGWLGSWDGYAKGSDTLDFIKIKVNEETALTFSDNISVTLLDKKGNAIAGADLDSIAAGEYVLRIEQEKKNGSIAYTIDIT